MGRQCVPTTCTAKDTQKKGPNTDVTSSPSEPDRESQANRECHEGRPSQPQRRGDHPEDKSFQPDRLGTDLGGVLSPLQGCVIPSQQGSNEPDKRISLTIFSQTDEISLTKRSRTAVKRIRKRQRNIGISKFSSPSSA